MFPKFKNAEAELTSALINTFSEFSESDADPLASVRANKQELRSWQEALQTLRDANEDLSKPLSGFGQQFQLASRMLQAVYRRWLFQYHKLPDAYQEVAHFEDETLEERQYRLKRYHRIVRDELLEQIWSGQTQEGLIRWLALLLYQTQPFTYLGPDAKEALLNHYKGYAEALFQNYHACQKEYVALVSKQVTSAVTVNLYHDAKLSFDADVFKNKIDALLEACIASFMAGATDKAVRTKFEQLKIFVINHHELIANGQINLNYGDIFQAVLAILQAHHLELRHKRKLKEFLKEHYGIEDLSSLALREDAQHTITTITASERQNKAFIAQYKGLDYLREPELLPHIPFRWLQHAGMLQLQSIRPHQVTREFLEALADFWPYPGVADLLVGINQHEGLLAQFSKHQNKYQVQVLLKFLPVQWVTVKTKLSLVLGLDEALLKHPFCPSLVQWLDKHTNQQVTVRHLRLLKAVLERGRARVEEQTIERVALLIKKLPKWHLTPQKLAWLIDLPDVWFSPAGIDYLQGMTPKTFGQLQFIKMSFVDGHFKTIEKFKAEQEEAAAKAWDELLQAAGVRPHGMTDAQFRFAKMLLNPEVETPILCELPLSVDGADGEERGIIQVSVNRPLTGEQLKRLAITLWNGQLPVHPQLYDAETILELHENQRPHPLNPNLSYENYQVVTLDDARHPHSNDLLFDIAYINRQLNLRRLQYKDKYRALHQRWFQAHQLDKVLAMHPLLLTYPGIDFLNTLAPDKLTYVVMRQIYQYCEDAVADNQSLSRQVAAVKQRVSDEILHKASAPDAADGDEVEAHEPAVVVHASAPPPPVRAVEKPHLVLLQSGAARQAPTAPELTEEERRRAEMEAAKQDKMKSLFGNDYTSSVVRPGNLFS